MLDLQGESGLYADRLFAMPQHPKGGVAPLRHDLALATYLEKQSACRALQHPDIEARLLVAALQRLFAHAVTLLRLAMIWAAFVLRRGLRFARLSAR